MYPKEYRYSEDHEWIQVDGDVATLGITDYAQNELGEVVYAEVPEVGSSFAAGEEIGSIESVKAVAEVLTPVSGEIVEINEALEDAPELLNEDPHAGGWIAKIRLTAPEELEKLMDAEKYEAFIETSE